MTILIYLQKTDAVSCRFVYKPDAFLSNKHSTNLADYEKLYFVKIAKLYYFEQNKTV